MSHLTALIGSGLLLTCHAAANYLPERPPWSMGCLNDGFGHTVASPLRLGGSKGFARLRQFNRLRSIGAFSAAMIDREPSSVRDISASAATDSGTRARGTRARDSRARDSRAGDTRAGGTRAKVTHRLRRARTSTPAIKGRSRLFVP
jgi:hypothetical protein